jgi:hypothetical protein
MCKSQVNADPFFVLTQNALADATYLEYLRGMYGAKIYTPTDEDSKKCFQDYMADAQERVQKHQLKPGENVAVGADGKIQVSGQVAVMEINGLLVKTIFDRNTNHEFYIEESFPFDWMYPYLEPHGLIMKINRQPLSELSDEIVKQDHDYWVKYVQPMIGDWLNDDTSVEKVAAFAKKTFGKQDFTGFTGDPRFIQNGPRGGFCLSPGLGLVPVFTGGRVPVREFPSETGAVFRRACRGGDRGANAVNARPGWRANTRSG